MYSELINLLTCGDLDANEREEMAQQIAAAPDDPVTPTPRYAPA